MSFSDDARIDKHQLDFEWLRQASLFHKYAEAYANAMFERDKAKERLDLVKAQVDSAIRSEPEDYGFLTKPTEPAIASAILQDPDYIEAKSKYLNSVREMNIVMGAKTAMEHKKSALETLSKLYLSGYWAEVRVSKEARKKYQESNDAEAEALNASARMQRRSKNG